MKIFKKIIVIKNKQDKVICNCCGSELDSRTDFLYVNKKWGYGTDLDGQRHSFDLCAECYKKMIGKFKIPPEKGI